MKHVFTLILGIILIPSCYGQTIASTNAGATSNNSLISSVGEVFTNPVNSDQAGSGGIGAVSVIEFFTLGIGDILSPGKLTLYPNPTSDFLFFETGDLSLKNIWVYNIQGKLIATKNITDKKVDLTSLKTGIYLIKINNSHKNSFKIIKK